MEKKKSKHRNTCTWESGGGRGGKEGERGGKRGCVNVAGNETKAPTDASACEGGCDGTVCAASGDVQRRYIQGYLYYGRGRF